MTQYFYSIPPEELPYSESIRKFFCDTYYKNKGLNPRHLSQKDKESFSENFHTQLPEVASHQKSDDGTEKFLLRLSDGEMIETVVLNFHKKKTLCLSTQVGCKMGCNFCFTAKMGLKRHLTPGEIVSQYLLIWQLLKKANPHEKKPNIVFMGQGEPLHNFKNLKIALNIFLSPMALHLGPRQITLSTVGHIPGLKRLKELPPINIAFSLHSPFSDERQKLIPMEQYFSLDQALELLQKHSLLKRQFITYEYLILGGINHFEKHALKLSTMLNSKKSLINLIPFNPAPGLYFRRPSEQEVEFFRQELVKKRFRVMVRQTKGNDILAACGQLNHQHQQIYQENQI